MNKAWLKPCPFCGEQPEVSEDEVKKLVTIRCRNQKCPAWLAVIIATDEDTAFAKWNTRFGDKNDMSKKEVKQMLEELVHRRRISNAADALYFEHKREVEKYLRCPVCGGFLGVYQNLDVVGFSCHKCGFFTDKVPWDKLVKLWFDKVALIETVKKAEQKGEGNGNPM